MNDWQAPTLFVLRMWFAIGVAEAAYWGEWGLVGLWLAGLVLACRPRSPTDRRDDDPK